MSPPRVSDPATIAAFLARLHDRRVVPVGPREYLAAERLLRSRDDWPEADLRAALASLLSGSREEWAAVATEFDATFHPQWVAAPPVQDQGPDQAGLVRRRSGWIRSANPPAGERPLPVSRSTLGRAWSIARNARRGWWVSGIALFIGALVAIAIEMLPLPAQGVDHTGPAGRPTPGPDETTHSFLMLLHPAETRTISVPLSPAPESIGTLAAIAVIALFLGGLGIRLIALPGASAAARASRTAERRAAARAARARLDEAQAASRESLRIRYYVPEWPALSRQAILDSTPSSPGRLLREERGDQWPTPCRTLGRTLAAGGCFTPVIRPRHVRQEVLLLVDIEEGDHPWLPGFLRVLDNWRRQGVRLLRFDFQMTPVSLVDPLTREGSRIDALARRTEGLPLIIFSRGLRPASRTGEAKWLGALKYWPVRAWLDPDPRPLAEHAALRRREVDALTRRYGLGRFPLSDSGVVTLARWLAADGESPQGVDWCAGLAPRWSEGDRPLGEALRKWALTAALVPDPSWDQLESIRRHFPEIHGVLGDRRDLQRLLDWVSEHTGAPVGLHGGRCLNIPERDVDQWIREQRAIARADPAQRGFEEGVRKLLLAQLEAAPAPETDLERQRQRLKIATHNAVIGQGSVQELLGWAFDAAVAHEASRWVRQELDRQQSVGLAASPFERSDWSRSRSGWPLTEVAIRELVWGTLASGCASSA